MASYKVLSDLVDGKKAGDTITDEDLEGCNVAALIEAGHLSGETKSTKADKE
jgi:hypothetical protein